MPPPLRVFMPCMPREQVVGVIGGVEEGKGRMGGVLRRHVGSVEEGEWAHRMMEVVGLGWVMEVV